VTRVAWPARAFLSIEEASVLLGISRATLYRSVQRGDFPVRVVHINGRLRVPRRSLERLMDGIDPVPQVGVTDGFTSPDADACPTCGSPSTAPLKSSPMCSAARRSSSSNPSV
jgi:excisionase family DNA binding protein